MILPVVVLGVTAIATTSQRVSVRNRRVDTKQPSAGGRGVPDNRRRVPSATNPIAARASVCSGSPDDLPLVVDNEQVHRVRWRPVRTICAASRSISANASAAVACSLTIVASRARSMQLNLSCQ